MNNQSVHGIIIIMVFLFFAAAMPFAAGKTEAPSPRPWNLDFNPLMAILMVALISAFFCLGFFLIYIHHWLEEIRNEVSVLPMNGTGAGRSRIGKRGLDRDVIETFPIINYSDVKGLKIGKGALECAVCLNEFEDDETLRLLPKCDHVFHTECIDAWLVAHVTCPVCRADLKPEAIDVVVTDDVAAVEVREVLDSNERNNEASEVTISVTDDQDSQSEVINPNQTPIQNGPVRVESTRIDVKFPRSHSTGHSLLLIQPGENCERFTLRLPEDVRKRIANGRLNRTTSCFAFPIGDGNVKSDGWMFSMAPPFITRTYSVKSQKVIDGHDSNGGNTSSVYAKGLRNSVKLTLPLDCLGAKSEVISVGDDVSNGRLPV